MDFYNREQELILLQKIKDRSEKSSQMTAIIGRRRIGKTRLILKSLEKSDFIYFFIAKKDEKLLCEEFIENIKGKFKLPLFGEIKQFRQVFEYILEAAKNENITLVIDEFQEFNSINNAIYSEMQNIWDRKSHKSKMNLILSGSIYSLMKKIFEHQKQPLFGRLNERIILNNFNVNILKNIIFDYNPNHNYKDFLAFYIFTGGIPKYVELFVDKKILTFNTMLDEIFRTNSYFIDEGKNILIEEFGKEYATYFSILSLIASSKNARSEIESLLNKSIGGYIDKLEYEYNIIKKIKPVFAKPGSRNIKYFIVDNFLNFWFRFIYKYRTAIEIGNYRYIKDIVKRDFNTYSGYFLEKYFKEKLSLTEEYLLIGTYWEKANENEIDIVAINDMKKKMLFAEVKINKKKISIDLLKEKARKLIQKHPDYTVEFKGFSIEDM